MQMVGHIRRGGVQLAKPTISGAWDAHLVANMADGSAWTIFSHAPAPAPAQQARSAGSPCFPELLDAQAAVQQGRKEGTHTQFTATRADDMDPSLCSP